MGLLKKVFNLMSNVAADYNADTHAINAIRYHIEMADDALYNYDATHNTHYHVAANRQIDAAELAQQHGINSVGYMRHCRLNNITPYVITPNRDDKMNTMSDNDADKYICHHCGYAPCACDCLGDLN